MRGWLRQLLLMMLVLALMVPARLHSAHAALAPAAPAPAASAHDHVTMHRHHAGAHHRPAQHDNTQAHQDLICAQACACLPIVAPERAFQPQQRVLARAMPVNSDLPRQTGPEGRYRPPWMLS